MHLYEHQEAAEVFDPHVTSLTRSEASQMFQGEFTHQNKCSECGEKTESRGSFWALPFELVDSAKKDCSVTDNQQLQMENLMRSSSAYLLFYRKQKDTSQVIREVSNNGGIQSDTRLNRKREKDVEAAEWDHHTVAKWENKKRELDNRGNRGRKTGVKKREDRFLGEITMLMDKTMKELIHYTGR
ncbi:uncharacterized protein LOC122973502 [Scomber scombrus]|uniref:Uncharacterized protein LOC122973502 n=1 Tax=Scomber scombrus TaxID=13677 RepID=A0AAV1N0R6_SCOSC